MVGQHARMMRPAYNSFKAGITEGLGLTAKLLTFPETFTVLSWNR
jgi:hypothetical protein